MFCNGRHDVQHEAIGFGHVGRHELDPAFHQAGNECDRPGQAVELGDHQAGLVLPAQGECGGELGSVVLPAALHLHELAQEPPSIDVGGDSGPLRFEAEAALPLPVCGNAKVGDDRERLVHGQVLCCVTDVSDRNTRSHTQSSDCQHCDRARLRLSRFCTTSLSVMLTGQPYAAMTA